MIVSVVAGGWSFSEVDQSKIPSPIIAVNDAAVHLSKARQVDCVVSMDRLWAENRWDWMVERGRNAYLRDAATKNLNHAGYDWLTVFKNGNKAASKFSTDPGTIEGDHSGYCALNVAYQWRPKRIYMFGFDMRLGPRGQRHWYGYQGWGPKDNSASGYRLVQWCKDMEVAAHCFHEAGIEVINVSSRSAITAFEKRRPNEMGFACSTSA
jgi:hypothetical protein